MSISDLMLPFMVGGILCYGIVKDVDVYNEFVQGAIEGVNTAFKIFPYILAIIFAINLFIRSGAEQFIVKSLEPIASIVNFPTELLSLAIIKPLSGSGSYGIIETIFQNYGPDSYIGRCAAVMMGSAETVFYTAAVYYGAVGITNGRYTLKVGIIVNILSVVVSLVVCRIIF